CISYISYFVSHFVRVMPRMSPQLVHITSALQNGIRIGSIDGAWICLHMTWELAIRDIAIRNRLLLLFLINECRES
ncbi:MAG: hypothetical protein ACFFAE_20355, partial [Candidatus Hodarchaeota archaeon]